MEDQVQYSQSRKSQNMEIHKVKVYKKTGQQNTHVYSDITDSNLL